jgi:hypothetical protein
MATKKLYVLTSNGGDGSCYPQYTFNEAWIKKMEAADASGDLDYETWADGDGFHYDIMTVPEECTLESLSIFDCAENDDEE